MIIFLKNNCENNELEKLKNTIKSMNLKFKLYNHGERNIIELIGEDRYFSKERFETFTCVEKVVKILKPYYLVSKEYKNETIIKFNDFEIKNNNFTIIAGPCSIEDRDMTFEIAHFLKENGIKIMRGGAFKPRTSPYSFQGNGMKALEYLKEASEKYNLLTVSEAVGIDVLKEIKNYVDIVQVGSRNSQNFELLKNLGSINKPVLLKRGFMNTIEEFLQSAEYIALRGNKNIILCERGIRTFENQTRNTLDISAFPLIKLNSNLPIISDPSHAAGRRDIIPTLAKASMASGANGIIVEIHPNPEKALSDGKQSLNFKEFQSMVKELINLSSALNIKIN
ncbi:phospho-2-dehydro-3-deoxyheptonate aldolase [Tepiditoga spiralis]|uniref:Phospho-2-dehydro-3-deoxyheptonate aldolase n=1 Tax=Tepiditoga spiralis TaxID=2108365 RepID=A0A7G1G8D8_9BACT|nr:3-deoxy-7-phosphoheptulonate synthase [Tepiditoga spiralis]BBE31494.1 phospho-2-dehydro-3-deoxyheptonate aldolase [Tepiditoga spiralis]